MGGSSSSKSKRRIRKTYDLDADEVRRVAQEMDISQSAAERELVRRHLVADAIMETLKDLHDMGAYADYDISPPPAPPLPEDFYIDDLLDYDKAADLVQVEAR